MAPTPDNKLPQKLSDNAIQRWVFKFYLFWADHAKNFRQSLVRALEILRYGLAAETEQTKEMMQIYLKQSKGRASPEDIKRANKQFRDLLRSMGLGVLLILPFAPLTLPIVVKLGRRLGVEVLPESFRGILDKQ